MPEEKTDAERIADLENRLATQAEDIDAIHLMIAVMLTRIDSKDATLPTLHAMGEVAKKPAINQHEAVLRAQKAILGKLAKVFQ